MPCDVLSKDSPGLDDSKLVGTFFIRPNPARQTNRIVMIQATRTWSNKALRFGSRLYSTQRTLFPTQTVRAILSDETAPGSSVTVRAWVRSVRKQKQVSFANVNDGTSLKGMQAILTSEQAEQ